MSQANDFMKFFRLKLRGEPELGILPKQVFYDREELLAGDDWHESIQTALDESAYFVFLISANSLSSNYCYSRELQRASERRLPIFPIILSECPWRTLPIRSDRPGPSLESIAALPKNDSFDLLPITLWKDRDQAWTSAVEQLTEGMKNPTRGLLGPSTAQLSEMTDRPSNSSALLPYYCNQQKVVQEFNTRVRAWDKSALLVLIRGEETDNLPRFWDRLRVKSLKDFLTMRNEKMLEPSPFILPIESRTRRRPEELLSTMTEALSDSLAHNWKQLSSKELLCEWLATHPGVTPLVANLPRQPCAVIAAGLRVLLDLLEQFPENAPLDRLVIAVIIEDRVLMECPNLKNFGLKGYRRTHVVNLSCLEAIADHDVRNWYRDNRVDAIAVMGEQELLQRVFTDHPARRLRLGEFDSRVRPLLRS
jgi:hypothetical protein